MIRRPPRSTLDRSSAASDVYKRQCLHQSLMSSVHSLLGLPLRPLPSIIPITTVLFFFYCPFCIYAQTDPISFSLLTVLDLPLCAIFFGPLRNLYTFLSDFQA